MRCAVYGCNVNNKGKNFSDEMPFHFHSFPKDEELCKQWVASCRRSEKFNKDTSRICSKHFAKDDYAGLSSFLRNLGISMKAQRLKPNALPSLFLPLNDEVKKCSKISLEKTKKRTRRRHFLCNSANTNLSHTYEITEFANAQPQPATDNEGTTSLETAGNHIEMFTPTDVKVEIIDVSPYEIDSCTQIDRLTPLRDNLSTREKCDATVSDHCLLKGDVTLPDVVFTHTPSPRKAQKRKSNWNLGEANPDRWHRAQLQFLDHVLLVWLNRCRSGNLNITMSDSMLKSKAKEAAKILDTFIVCPTTWIREFKDKLRKEDARQSAKYDPHLFEQSKDIADIIEEEWTRFRCEDGESLSQGNQPKANEETNPGVRSYEEALAIPLDERSNVMENSIDSYQEALDCLMMVKRYAFCVRNLSAVVIITELEDILKLECL